MDQLDAKIIRVKLDAVAYIISREPCANTRKVWTKYAIRKLEKLIAEYESEKRSSSN